MCLEGFLGSGLRFVCCVAVSGGTSVAVDTRSADAWAGGSSSHGSPGPADLPAWDARTLRHWTASSSAVSTPDPEAWEWTEAAQRAYWRQI
ncbi:hypothetical protein R5R35_009499 [Gryllus longicercus]|uniref:Accessory gland protein n=1 Tax=Gryllus longicercus TaxID=2509291 RepID=A0AAN9V5D6_9ORTH